MIPAPDILGIECWVLILFRFKSSPTEQYLINPNRNNIELEEWLGYDRTIFD
jgi:hypothetical protein